jgi:hypothetical protein
VLLKFWKLRINSRIKSARVDLGFDLEVRIRASQELIRPSENLRVVPVTHGCFLCGGFTPL